ncbi:MAG: carboxypeptidase M32 [Pseudomonadales bacterium]
MSYKQLHEHFSQIYDLRHVEAITSWDEASMMPVGGGEVRGRALSTLSVVIHNLLADPALDGLMDAAAKEDLTDWQEANVREMARQILAETSLPSDLVKRMGLATAKSEQAWRVHRAVNNWDAMQPLLTEVVSLYREKSQVLGEALGCSPYNALLDGYEPGATTEKVDAVFSDLKSFLPGFVNEVVEKQSGEELLPIAGDFSIERQRSLGIAVMSALGFDFDHGRLDVSHHPFCGGVPDDVRITTRYNTGNFVESLMAVIHETGHALYEQGLPQDWRDQPVGEALSSGTHESQSLLMEMQACRTEAFLKFLAPMAQRAFLGSQSNDPAWSVDNLYRHYTRVEKSLIRVDADEVTYPLHVILRYEIEKALIEGELEVAELPDAWDEGMRTLLELDTIGNFKDGCLQDVHWPAGLFGYFPTYTLGAMTAAQLFASATAELGTIYQDIGEGRFENLLAWLRSNVHSKGKFLSYDDLMLEATGSGLDASWFKRHVRQRYLTD